MRNNSNKNNRPRRNGGRRGNQNQNRREPNPDETTLIGYGRKISTRMKKFKLSLAGDAVEELQVPIYGDGSPAETLLILTKEFTEAVDDADLW